MASSSRASTSSRTGSPDGASTSKLQRGAACFSCRRRKRRCDGNLPCSQCSHLDIEDECEYADGGKRAIAHILQENIEHLENRIHDLEHPHRPRSDHAVPLHQPYHPSGTPRPKRASSEPPKEMIEQLIDHFLAYASEFGFFMNAPRFRQSALLPLQPGHPSRPAPALLATAYLWGLRLSGQPALLAQEPAFLARALRLTSKGLAAPHPQRVLHTLQAEVLLAYWFFAAGRVLEGKYHSAAAVSLGLSGGLHLVRSRTQSATGPGVLPPAGDVVEEGERIHAWWAVMVMDKCWAVGLCETPSFAHRDSLAMVDTPWPLECDDYEKGYLAPSARYSHTIQKFVNDVPTSDTGLSTVAMLAKAAIVWQRADDLARTWKPGMSPPTAALFRTEFTRLDALIDRFRLALVPPNRVPAPTPAMTRALVVAHSVAHAASVRLHSLFAHTDAGAQRKRLAAARSILGIIAAVPMRHLRFVNPVMGTVWVAACGVFIDEITALGVRYPGPPPHDEELNLRAFLARAAGAIAGFQATFPLLQSQIGGLLESCRMIGVLV
ncbi:hypothetical protein C8R46DRAFT_1226397 [Mycena filopes]|nr:hypothetical protein C8R46DRAFT_1226397 [Mycena filopes]